MLQELAAETGASLWAIGSMAFFFLVWLGIAVWVYRSRPEDFSARARLALEDDMNEWHGVPSRPRSDR
jgi:cbb3-type cytochrome oxidase subunit 3